MQTYCISYLQGRNSSLLQLEGRREKVEILEIIDKKGIPKKSHKKEVNKEK